MDVTRYVTALRDDLTAAAGAGDEQTQRTAALLAAAIEPGARLAIMNALADLANEVTDALDGDRTVEIRLDGREVKVVVSEPLPAAGPPPPPPPPFGDSGDISRITLRLMEEIKGRAEQAANQQGVSLNAWISQAVQGALRGHRSGRWDDPGRRTPGGGRGGRSNSGSHLKGWVQG